MRLQVEIEFPLGRPYIPGREADTVVSTRVTDDEYWEITKAAQKMSVSRSQYILAVLTHVSACINNTNEEVEYEC